MEVSSVNSSASVQGVQVEVMKKAQEVQEQQVVKMLETATEQSKEVTAQKTGVGRSLNIVG